MSMYLITVPGASYAMDYSNVADAMQDVEAILHPKRGWTSTWRTFGDGALFLTRYNSKGATLPGSAVIRKCK